MPQKPETKFQKKVTDILDDIPGLWYFKAQLVARRGIPDLIICYCGFMVAWELKTEEGKPSALQSHNLAQIDKAGGVARVVRPSNLDECLKELYDLVQKQPANREASAAHHHDTDCTCRYCCPDHIR